MQSHSITIKQRLLNDVGKQVTRSCLVCSEPGVFTEVAEERRETAHPLSALLPGQEYSSSDISNLVENPNLIQRHTKMVGGATS